MPKIDELYAYVAEDNGPDDEGITAFWTPQDGWMPMVGADEDRLESLRETAQEIANSSGKPIRVLRFSQREEVELIVPAEEKDAEEPR